MPWNGSGVWSPIYTWVVEANAGVKILASHQDAQWADLASSLANVKTLDGQNKPSADWDFNGHKITNLAAPSAPTDVARLADVVSTATEWLTESATCQFLGVASFKVLATNVTAKYSPGRAVRVTHNNGASVSYYYVLSSSFSTDTTVNLSSGTTLLSPITKVEYGIISAGITGVPSSFPVGSAVGVTATAQTGVGTSLTKVNFNTVTCDALSEFDPTTNKRFTALVPGRYLVNTSCSFYNDLANCNITLGIYLTGVQQAYTKIKNQTSATEDILSANALLTLSAGSYIEIFMQFTNASGNTINEHGGGTLAINRVW